MSRKNTLQLDWLGRIAQLRTTLGDLERLDAPFRSRSRLRRLLELLDNLGRLTGGDDSFLDQIRSVLDNPQLIEIIFTLVQFALGNATASGPRAQSVKVSAVDLARWLPLVVRLLTLLAEFFEEPADGGADAPVASLPQG